MVASGAGTKLSAEAWAKAPTLWRVDGAVFGLKDQDKDDGFLAVKLLGDHDKAHWLRMDSGQQSRMVGPTRWPPSHSVSAVAYRS